MSYVKKAEQGRRWSMRLTTGGAYLQVRGAFPRAFTKVRYTSDVMPLDRSAPDSFLFSLVGLRVLLDRCFAGPAKIQQAPQHQHHTPQVPIFWGGRPLAYQLLESRT
jgi:hypothetical protein